MDGVSEVGESIFYQIHVRFRDDRLVDGHPVYIWPVLYDEGEGFWVGSLVRSAYEIPPELLGAALDQITARSGVEAVAIRRLVYRESEGRAVDNGPGSQNGCPGDVVARDSF